MQVSSTILLVAAELYAALLVGAVILFFYAQKLKVLIKKQQTKMLELINEKKNAPPVPRHAPVEPAPVQAPRPLVKPTQDYKDYRRQMQTATDTKYALIAPGCDIESEQTGEISLLQNILVLRHAFLRAETLSDGEIVGTEKYWTIFEQTLSPLLAKPANSNEQHEEFAPSEPQVDIEQLENQLEDYRNQLEDYRSQVEDYKNQANDYKNQAESLEKLIQTLNSPNHETNTFDDSPLDPDTADEVANLRNVAASQYRIINQLQAKLMAASTASEKELVIQELQQQLQRQTRFVQESEASVELLEDELAKTQEALLLKEKTLKEKILEEEALLARENDRKQEEALHNVSFDDDEMLNGLGALDMENIELEEVQEVAAEKPTIKKSATLVPEKLAEKPAAPLPELDVKALEKIQTEYIDLQKQYAELQKKYLGLKSGT